MKNWLTFKSQFPNPNDQPACHSPAAQGRWRAGQILNPSYLWSFKHWSFIGHWTLGLGHFTFILILPINLEKIN